MVYMVDMFFACGIWRVADALDLASGSWFCLLSQRECTYSDHGQ